MIIVATRIRTGMIIIHNKELCRVVNMTHVTPGQGRGMVQTKLKNIVTGNGFEQRFRSDEKIERATLEQREMEFLYQDGDEFIFMDTGTYEQINLTDEILGDGTNYLIPNIKVMVEMHEGNPLGVELPKTVELEVIETEPEMKGATASASAKPATLETGVVVQVPQFIKAGEKVKIDTVDGSYLERGK